MTAAGGSRRFDWFALFRRSGLEQQNTPAGPLNVRGGRLSIVLGFGAIAIGITALTGYFLASAPIAALSAHGKPVSAVTALALIALGSGLLALRSPAPAGVSTARRAILVAVVLAAADLLSWALSPNLEAWQVWAARGGVMLHSYAVTTLLILALGAALFLVTTRRDFAGHVIASLVLLICVALLFAYVLGFAAFLDPVRRVAPVLAATVGLALVSVAGLLVRPRGWVVPLLSRTPTGLMTRVLLLATLIVPVLADLLRDLIGGMPWLDVDVSHAVVVDVVEVFFSAGIVLAVGLLLHKRESDRMRLASIVESSGDAIIGTSSAGLIESWNAGAEAMFGYTAAEALGRSPALIAPPERHDEASRIFARIRLGEHPDAFETVRVAKDGSRIDVWLRLSPIVDDAGTLVGASVIAHDITRRKRAEKAMVESEARYRTLVENLPLKVMLKDRNSVYVSANEAYARDLGIEPKAVAGKTDYDFFPEDLAAKYRADDARIMEAGVTEDLEEEYVERGQRRYIQTVKTPVRDPQGNVTNILVILWDITAKRLAEDQLQTAMVELERSNRELARSEAALKEAQRIAQVGHWERSLVTSAGTWSDEVYRILGIPIGSVTTDYETFLRMIVPQDRGRYEDEVDRAISSSGAEGTQVDLRVATAGGAVVVVSCGMFVDRDTAGTAVGMHGTIQDITRRVAAEEALRQHSESLDRSNLELERFNRLAIGRELRMVELKQQINDLCAQVGQPAQYVLPEERAVPLDLHIPDQP